jgi:hypothetical protein
MARVYAMKQSHTPSSSTSEDRSLGFGYFIRYAAKHTAFAVVVYLAVGLLLTGFFGIASLVTSHQFEPLLIWKVVGLFFVLTVPVLWVATIFVGCLIMIPVEICRLIQLHVRNNPKNTAPEARLWDRSLDGPGPL